MSQLKVLQDESLNINREKPKRVFDERHMLLHTRHNIVDWLQVSAASGVRELHQYLICELV